MGDIKFCPVCKEVAQFSFEKKESLYYQCSCCCVIFTSSIDEHCFITENEASFQRNNFEVNAERLRRKKMFSGGKDIIDFGCGDGSYVQFLKAQGFDAVGIDKKTLLQLDAVPNQSVDIINMVEVVEHLFEPNMLFSEFRRILRSDGLVYIETSLSFNRGDLLDWDYCDPTIGHCTLHNLNSLAILAQHNGFVLIVLNFNVFLFKKLS